MSERSKTRFVLLGLLSEGPLTGYEIKKLIDLRFSFFWSESYGQIYPMLKSLEADGLILPEIKEQSGRGAVVYGLTLAGLEALQSWLEKPPETETVRFELLLKMYFSHLTQPSHMLAHLRGFREQHARQLALLQLFAAELEKIADQDNHGEILRVIDFGQKTYTAYLDWCRETERFLQKREEEKK